MAINGAFMLFSPFSRGSPLRPTFVEKLAILDACDGASRERGAPAVAVTDDDLRQVLSDHGFSADALQVAVVRERLCSLTVEMPIVAGKPEIFSQKCERWIKAHHKALTTCVTVGVLLLFWNGLGHAHHTLFNSFFVVLIGAMMSKIFMWAIFGSDEARARLLKIKPPSI